MHIAKPVFLLAFLGSCASFAMPTSNDKSALTIHNALRQKHNAPPLEWDDELAKYAANYAAQCQFKHSKGGYGENLAAGFPSTKDAIETWYAEKKYYSYRFPGYSAKTGHFTQIVWKSTAKLGCAVAVCDGKHGTPGNYLVCEYSPPGNVTNPGYFRRNVASP